MNPLFEYMNFRDYLRDYYEDKKKAHAFYSFRLFSQKAGFTSPNFFKLVIDGKRNLSKESAFKFSKALGHTKKEADYFENLVFFNQSKTLEEKNAYLSNVMRFRGKSDPKKIEESEYSYYSNWYNPVIRELVIAMDFKENFKKLGQAAIPAISEAEARQSVKLLAELGFIQKNGDGTYSKTSAVLTTGPQVRSVAIANYHKVMMQRASESIERFSAVQRDISSLTLSVSPQAFAAIIARIQDFRKEILELSEMDENRQKVVQLNLQLFPLSNSFDKPGDKE
jgi:uncharacterized protein (TIGR02147 family)